MMKESRPKRTWRGRRGRRAGESQPQAWTKKARDDIYARRQAGEHWETIYPVWRRSATLNCDKGLTEEGLPGSNPCGDAATILGK